MACSEVLAEFGLHVCGLRKKDVKQCIDEVKAGIIKIKLQLKKFSAEHKEYSELCERISSIMNSYPEV